MSILCDSLKRQETIKVWVLPNNDAGSSIVKNEIFNNKDPNNIIFDNLPRSEYLELLKNCQLLIGNSSSGIIESSSFKVPVINLGRRQNNRYRPKNVIDLKKISMKLILKNIKKATSQKFYRIVKNIKNPYGDGNSSKKIIKILIQTKVDDKLLFKSLTY